MNTACYSRRRHTRVRSSKVLLLLALDSDGNDDVEQKRREALTRCCSLVSLHFSMVAAFSFMLLLHTVPFFMINVSLIAVMYRSIMKMATNSTFHHIA